MQLPELRMSSQMAQINIDQKKGEQEIEQPNATLHISQPEAELDIETNPPKLEIDQSKAWEDMNLLSVSKSIEAHSEAGKNGVLEGTGRRAREGDELMQIEKDGSPIAEQAMRNAYSSQKQLGIEFIPSPFAVETIYESGEATIKVTRHEPVIDAKANQTIHRYEQGDVTTGMEQYPELQIDVVNLYA